MTHNAHPVPPADDAVDWFGQSSRIIGNRPDSRYGWFATPEGACIVKALDCDLVPYATALLQHERRALRRLQELGTPAPRLVELGRPDWLVTRFSGLSLSLLGDRSALGGASVASRFPWHEQVSAWVHLLRRLQPMGDAGVLMVDLHGGNVVVPLTHHEHGQLRLNEVTTIDHAHTLEAGMDMRRPVWLYAGMPRIAPELRAALTRDQQTFQAACQAADVDLPGYSMSRMPVDRDAANRRFWAEYDAPQELQRLLDSGGLGAALAMQFAAGMSIARLADTAPDSGSGSALKAVAQRMTESDPGGRFASLVAAGEALADIVGRPALVGVHRYAPLLPKDLCARPAPQAPESARPSAAAAAHAGVGTSVFQGGTTARTDWPTTLLAASEYRPPRLTRWLLLAAALGGALGAAAPVPW